MPQTLTKSVEKRERDSLHGAATTTVQDGSETPDDLSPLLGQLLISKGNTLMASDSAANNGASDNNSSREDIMRRKDLLRGVLREEQQQQQLGERHLKTKKKQANSKFEHTSLVKAKRASD